MFKVFVAMLLVSQSTGAAPLTDYEAIQQKAYGRYFDQIAEMGRLESRTAQGAGWLYGFVGRSDLIYTLQSRYVRSALNECDVPEAAVAVGDALGDLIAASRDRRVLLLNESHTQNHPRRFLFDNLERFWEAGYRHIGFEALWKPLESVEHLDAADGSYGIYLNDPLLRMAMRKALMLGFKIFPYEFQGPYPQGESQQQHFVVRERGQANNIADYLSTVSDDEKVLVWAGYQHISKSWNFEQSEANNWAWMAARLEHEFGIGTFSVDLTQCQYESETGYGSRLFYSDGETLVLGEAKSRWKVDAQLHLPSRRGMTPGYYREAIGQAVQIPEPLRALSDQMLVEAYAKGQPETGFSYDTILLRGGEDFSLYLPIGEYTFVAYDKDGMRLGEATVFVSLDQN